MGIELDLSKNILAPPDVVWSLLAHPPAWGTWWRDCVSAHTADGRAAREGSTVEVVLKPGEKPSSYKPVIDLFTEHRTLSMTHRSSLSQGTCVWFLNKRPRGTEVRIQLVYEGIGSWWVRLSGRRILIQLAFENQLKDLKKYSERMV